MAGTHGKVDLPAAAGSKQVPQGVMQEINYANRTLDINENDPVTFENSTWTGTIVRVKAATGTTGELHVRIEEPVPDPVPAMINAEEIRVNAVKVAEVTTPLTDPYYFQQTQLVGKDMVNPVRITKRGEIITANDKGSPQYDAFGKMRVSQQTIIGEYINSYEIDTKNFWIEETGGGTVTHIPGNQGTLLSVGTASGDKAAITSHLYHKYQLGTSQLIEMTFASGDSGKTNLREIHGYGDINDGLFFRKEGTTGWQVFMRSSTIGDHAVDQADWNIDRLDGSGGEFNLSGHTLDNTKDNIAWLMYEWLGAGTVWFGYVIEGEYITCHEMYHANLYTQPYMRTGSLPIHHGLSNIGVTGSSSESRLWCSVVKTEGKFEPQAIEHYHHIRKREKQNGGIYFAAVMNWHPGRMMFAIRPKLTINSITNRRVAFPVLLAVTNTGTDSMFIQARRGASLVGTPNWIDFHSESGLEYNEDDASNIDQDNRGVQVGMWSIPPQSTENINLRDVFGYRKERCLLTADNSQDEFTYVFTAWNMSAIAHGSDAGDHIVTIAAAGNTITKTGGAAPNFDVANYDGVAFADTQMIYLRNSVSDDGYYLISTAPTSTVLTVKNLDGSAVSFTGSVGDTVTIQGGTRSLFFGSLNVEEII